MADPLLTSLCSICHILPPKYKCPGCGARTCSQGCVRKHKKWSECTGERDPTAYVPVRSLRTPAGIDHDYNFISKIERSRERSERLLVEDRHIVGTRELRPITVQEIRYKTMPDGRRKRYLATRVIQPGRQLGTYRIRQRAKKLDITVIYAPAGMSRRKENRTRWDKRMNQLAWQVEWLLHGNETSSEPVKYLSHVFEEMTVQEGFARLLAPSRPTGDQIQNGSRGVWGMGRYSFQDPLTARWTGQFGSQVDLEEQYRFFLAVPLTRPQEIIPLKSTSTLADALRYQKIFEFPTIYVFPKEGPVPGTFAVSSPRRRPERSEAGWKRNRSQHQFSPQKRRRQMPAKKPDRDVEDGEVSEDGEILDSDAASDHGRGGAGAALVDYDSSSESDAGDGGLEGETEEELSLGEEVSDEDADTTSSSGTDSDVD